ncbi:MAG: winged helix-turn-helix transcriptional regulator [Candidatus Onthomonas sp.]
MRLSRWETEGQPLQWTQFFHFLASHLEYSLSDSGKELYPIFYEMALWGSRYL